LLPVFSGIFLDFLHVILDDKAWAGADVAIAIDRVKANLGNPWLNFEAGILAKQLKRDQPGETLVCPLLIDMAESDLTGPFTLLQYLPFDEHGLLRVAQMVNKHAIPEPRKEAVVENAFQLCWQKIKTELDQMQVPEQSAKPTRSVGEMLEEVLGIVRSIDKASTLSSWLSYAERSRYRIVATSASAGFLLDSL
jgi:hypothetical protein